ncbi:hypothetical protein EYZ11_008496 [Aspergillus tanneri]|uniref:Uncharacterized protein n=1 Tax=Aspergillus tanneri TaxID=1220188 RepID=A0A4S3JAA6_9EURO|nr:uncharacterized protein ATNIH1004_010015 [Aspergillus tanneri]KAA8643248.1 hypothetical protein ATNIH1004_010015 [Aspergillus tanneri]THC92029.1 hypothetical protein EYZ11_008496 [Aspergillus tanneri]
MTRRAVPRPAGAATERFRQSALQPARGDAQSQATGRPRLATYLEYEYPDNAFQGGSLQHDELQPYPPTLRDQQRQQVQSFASYEPEMVYNLGQQGPTQSLYEVVPQYAARQSAAMDTLSSQFAVPAVPQYYNEPTGAGVPAGPIGRSNTAQPFPTTMADMTPVGTAGRLEPSPPPQQQQPQPQPPPPSQGVSEINLNEAYGQFHRALRGTFDHTRAGRLVEASRSLLEISEWLVTNARELGRQPPHTRLLSSEVTENLGKELISLCDRIEQHGLVDYQMGIWEEEILCVLGQCLDLMESRPEVLRAHAIVVPATATSRS